MSGVTDGTKVYPPHAFERELDIACRAVVEAGRSLRAIHNQQISSTESDSSPAACAAEVSERIIRATIEKAFPGDAILSEAYQDPGARIGASRVWIVDPLDGAGEFGKGKTDFSVMVALLQDDALHVSAVYRPVAELLYYAVAGGGAYRSNGHGPELLRCMPSNNGSHVVAARSPGDPIALRLCEQDGFTEVAASGSVGAQCTRIAEGARDVYVQLTPSMAEWDTAAPELIVTEAGGCVTDCLGRALSYNKEVPLQSAGVLAAHPSLTFRIIPTLAHFMNNGKRRPFSWRLYGK